MKKVRSVQVDNSVKKDTEKKVATQPSRQSLKDSKEVQNLLNTINKTYGINAVRLGADLDVDKPLIRIPTSNPSLDIDLGGGIPVGRYTEISGAFSSTKTTQSLHIMRNAINMGFKPFFADVEGTSGTEDGQPDRDYFNALGINVDDFIYSRPDSLEECTQMILDFQRSGIINFAIWDSLAMTEANKLLESEMDETVQMGIKQKLLGEFFAKYQLNNNRLVREGKTPFTLICLNQLREKIGGYGDPEYTPGGRAKGFASSVEIRLRQGDLIMNSDKEVVGQVVKYKINKNKTYMRLKSGEFNMYLDENEMGIKPFFTDVERSIVVEAVAYGLIERGGAWFYLDPDKTLKFNGLDNLVAYLKEHPDTIEDLKQQILNLAKKTV